MDELPVRCLMCYQPFAARDVVATEHYYVYVCRNCGCERTLSKQLVSSIYGPNGKRIDSLIDQARRLEG